MSDIVERLDKLGRTDPRWPKSALTYFSRSNARVHIIDVERFFKEAVALAEEASRTIHELRNQIADLESEARDGAFERDLAGE